jgi:hypothetical protein
MGHGESEKNAAAVVLNQLGLLAPVRITDNSAY